MNIHNSFSRPPKKKPSNHLSCLSIGKSLHILILHQQGREKHNQTHVSLLLVQLPKMVAADKDESDQKQVPWTQSKSLIAVGGGEKETAGTQTIRTSPIAFHHKHQVEANIQHNLPETQVPIGNVGFCCSKDHLTYQTKCLPSIVFSRMNLQRQMLRENS